MNLKLTEIMIIIIFSGYIKIVISNIIILKRYNIVLRILWINQWRFDLNWVTKAFMFNKYNHWSS